MKQLKSSIHLNDVWREAVAEGEADIFELGNLRNELKESGFADWAVYDDNNGVDTFTYKPVFADEKKDYGCNNDFMCVWLATDNNSPFKPDFNSEASLIEQAKGEALFFPEGYDIKDYIVEYRQTIYS